MMEREHRASYANSDDSEPKNHDRKRSTLCAPRESMRLHRFLSLLLIHFILLASLFTMAPAYAHGAVEYPISRQYKCYLDGDYWGDPKNIADPGCRAAVLATSYVPGHYAFQQWNEIAANVLEYNEQREVEAEVPDGLLCSAGDARKSGLDNPSPDWYRTEVKPVDGKIRIALHATAPHNPNFFRIYLSRASYDGSRPLRWNDLDEIHYERDIKATESAGKKYYFIDVALPPDRTGDAVLYTRWQRVDPAGEGFYNCSDIRIPGGSPDPFPWHESGPFVPQGFEPNVGEAVRFRVLSHERSGRELVDEILPITHQNHPLSVWPAQLAATINSKYSIVRIGAKSGNNIVYDEVDVHRNMVYLRNDGDSFAISIVPPPSPGNGVSIAIDVDNSGTAPALIKLHAEAETLENEEIRRVDFYNGDVLLDTVTNEPYEYVWREVPAGTYMIRARAVDSRNEVAETPSTAVTVQSGVVGDYPKWPEGIGSYVPDETVVRGADDDLWKCRPLPEGAWCNIKSPLYEPGGPAYVQDPNEQPWARVD